MTRGRERPAEAGERVATDLVVPCFGSESHVIIDGRRSFVRDCAATREGSQRAVVLDPDRLARGVRADCAPRSRGTS